MLSIHQAPLLAEIASRPDFRVILMSDTEIPASRAQQGWHARNFGQTEVRVASDPNEILEVVRLPRDETIHVVSGLRHHVLGVREIIKHWSNNNSRVILYSEPWDDRGWSGKARGLLYKFLAVKHRRLFSAVLATGEKAEQQFKKIGFREVFPFAYFVSNFVNQNVGINKSPSSEKLINFLYVGRFIEIKNVKKLINEFTRLPIPTALTMIGSGVLESELLSQANISKTGPQVQILPNLPNEEVRERMTQADVLVLPSTHDGWGAVVNEALSVGTPVVVSEACGSSELIDRTRGETFNPFTTDGLYKALLSIRNRIHAGAYHRDKIVEWADLYASPRAGADYFTSIVRYLDERSVGRPTAPWRENYETNPHDQYDC